MMLFRMIKPAIIHENIQTKGVLSGVVKQNTLVCKKCGEDFIFKPNETFWDEKGTFSVKLTKCRNCGCPNVIKTEREHNVNFDKRYYAY